MDHTPFLKIVVQGKGHMGNRVAFVFVTRRNRIDKTRIEQKLTSYLTIKLTNRRSAVTVGSATRSGVLLQKLTNELTNKLTNN